MSALLVPRTPLLAAVLLAIALLAARTPAPAREPPLPVEESILGWWREPLTDQYVVVRVTYDGVMLSDWGWGCVRTIRVHQYRRYGELLFVFDESDGGRWLERTEPFID